MDGNVRHERDLNPGQNASILSRITFFFALRIFHRASKPQFNTEDVFGNLNSLSSKCLGDKLEALWNVEKIKRNPHIFKPIVKMFGFEYVLLGVLDMVASTSMMITKPILIGKIISYFTPTRTEVIERQVITYAVLLIGCIFLGAIFVQLYAFTIKVFALKVRIACSALIFRKSIRLNTYTTTTVNCGKIITLMTKDVEAFQAVMIMTHQVLTGVVKTLAMGYVMYVHIGISAGIGLSVPLLFVPLLAFLGYKTTYYKLRVVEKADKRIHLTQQILSNIKDIKMLVWEKYCCKVIDILRRKEIQNFRILIYVKALAYCAAFFGAKLSLYISIITFAALGHRVTAEKAFTVVSCFTNLRAVLSVYIPLSFLKIGEMRATLSRIDKYLLQNEVGDKLKITPEEKGVVIENAIMDSNTNLQFKPGITLITGVIGSGKSTLLMAILGEVKINMKISICGEVSYASQQPWLFQGTIKQNIIFNEVFDEARYQNVLHICGLEKDLDAFVHGEETLLTNRGINLSDGQKARINLARAVYKSADIYILDDCLACIDPQVANYIFWKCIKGFLGKKVCVLVSHLDKFLNDVDEIVLLNGGRVDFVGNYSELRKSGRKSIVEKYECNLTGDDKMIENDFQSKRVTECSNFVEDKYRLKEDNEEFTQNNAINRDVYYKYFSLGGIKLFLVFIMLSMLGQGIDSLSEYYVGFWVDSETNLSAIETEYVLNSTEYIQAQNSNITLVIQYSATVFTALLLMSLKFFIFYKFACRASVNIHKKLVDVIVRACMIFFNQNPTGNIINRFSRDLNIVDEDLPSPLFDGIKVTLSLVATLIVVSSINPWFLIPSACFALVLYIGCGNYLPAARNIRRIEGSTRDPVIRHVEATFDGLTTIRASGAQKVIINEFDRHYDLYNSTQYMHLATAESFSFFMDLFTGFYISVIIFALYFFESSLSAGKAGLAITQSFALTNILQQFVVYWAELEVKMTSTERILEYMSVKSESNTGKTIEQWPNRGKIEYKDVHLQHYQGIRPTLANINFTVKPGEKLGVVGRTGAGKSSLISALFRLYEFDGSITVDDVDIKSLKLDTLRSKISIITQDPVLFSGTIRSNLDPKSQYDDSKLWNALHKVALNDQIDDLWLPVAEAGSNFSAGQRQLLCLARAIVQNNSIIVLDEATCNVDSETEIFMQRTIKKVFENNTVIVIAHRLVTIMDCDKLLVLDDGNIVEYDCVKNLLDDKTSAFYGMAKEAGILLCTKEVSK